MKKWLLVIGISLLFVPIVINLIVGTTNPVDCIKVANDDTGWLGFFGSYVGAIIGAMITLFVLYRESKNNALSIMIHNQENLIKDLKEQLAARIGTVDFGRLSNFALYTLKTDEPIDRGRIDDTLKLLDDYHNVATQQGNAWGIAYADDEREIVKQFNSSYLACIKQYQKDINDITRQLYDLKTNGQQDDFKKWLKTFCETLSGHQDEYTLKMYDFAKLWLQKEREKLESLQKHIGVSSKSQKQ